jgi:GTP-binding protein
MLNEDRMITGPEAGITRDSISIDWHWTDQAGVTHPVRLIDTAGLRKRAKVDDKLERLSAARHQARDRFRRSGGIAARRDARARGAGSAHRRPGARGRPRLVIALNKWDVAEHASSLFNGVKAALLEGLSQLKDVPLLTVSGRPARASTS